MVLRDFHELVYDLLKAVRELDHPLQSVNLRSPLQITIRWSFFHSADFTAPVHLEALDKLPLPPGERGRIHSMDTSPQLRQPWWRFSIREMLLVMVAVGAGISVWLNDRPVRPTRFFREFELVSRLQAASAEQGIKPSISATTREYSNMGTIVFGRTAAMIRADEAIAALLIDELRDDCEADLGKERAKFLFRRNVGEESAPAGFILVYRRNSTTGSISVFCAERKPGEIEVIALRQESRD